MHLIYSVFFPTIQKFTILQTILSAWCMVARISDCNTETKFFFVIQFTFFFISCTILVQKSMAYSITPKYAEKQNSQLVKLFCSFLLHDGKTKIRYTTFILLNFSKLHINLIANSCYLGNNPSMATKSVTSPFTGGFTGIKFIILENGSKTGLQPSNTGKNNRFLRKCN